MHDDSIRGAEMINIVEHGRKETESLITLMSP